MTRSVGTAEKPSGPSGTHLCWRYDEPRHFHEAASEFLAEGHANGERLVFVGPGDHDELAGQITGLDVESLEAEGSLHLQPVDALYGAGRFNPAAQVAVFAEMVERALAGGYRGMRVAADVTRLAEDDWTAFAAYEAMADRLISTRPIAGMCAYQSGAADLPELAALHPAHNLSDHEQLAGRTWFDDGHLHMAGEFDLVTERVFDSALGAVHGAAGDETLDLTGLEFIDVAGLLKLERLAAHLACCGRRLRVVAPPRPLRRHADLLGFAYLKGALAA